MTDELIAYLLDDLSPERRAAVDAKLASDVAWQRELERLRECLAAGADPEQLADDCAEPPPSDLVERTCFLVKYSDKLRPPTAAAFTEASPWWGGGRARWSLADLTVGGGVLLLLAALVLPAMFESRDAARRSVCQSNLQQLGAALFNYQEVRDHRLPAVGPGENAGINAVELLERGGLSRGQLTELLLCPQSQLADDVAAGRVVLVIPTRREFDAAVGEQRRAMVVTMGGSFAYRLGYREAGALRQPRFTGEESLPLMADAPEFSAEGVRSANHARGHNVLYECLSVSFRTNCMLPDRRDNFYLNAENRPAAGRHRGDIVLGGSAIGPDGPLVPVSIVRD